MSNIGKVATGEVNIVSAEEYTTLQSTAIGSCVVIAVYDPKMKLAAMAHIMLPGYAPENEVEVKTKYAGNAIEVLTEGLKSAGSCIDALDICIVGAANVLNRSDDTIAKSNLDSVVNILIEKGISIKAESVGGILRKCVSIDVKNGSIFFSTGDDIERLLWSPGERELKEWPAQP